MKTRTLASIGVLIAVLMVLAIPVVAAGKGNMLHVGPGREYATIQAAVDAAKQGSTILVYPDLYEEHVLIAKNNLWIIAQGEGVVVDPPDSAGFEVNADHVTIRGFEILAGRECALAILFEGSHNTFAENTIASDPQSQCFDASAVKCIDLDGGSDYNTIEDNEIGAGYAIQVLSFAPDAVNRGNVIQNNTIFGFDLGIYVRNGEGFRISGNTVVGEFGDCIVITAGNDVSQGNHRIRDNTVLKCGSEGIGGGVILSAENDAILTHNHITSNKISQTLGTGLILRAASGGTVSNNLILDNLVYRNPVNGISLEPGSDSNRIFNNEVQTNNNVGIEVAGDNNLIVGNWAWNNTVDLADEGEGNRWINNTVSD